jgi:short subunit fatty acids transporter
MAQPLSSPKAVVMSRPRDAARLAIVWGLGLVGGGLLAAALALWFHYGTTVFFETIAAGFASCF